MKALFIFKSLHPSNDSSSLHNAQNMRRTTQPHEAIGSLGCSHTSFMLTQAYQSGPLCKKKLEQVETVREWSTSPWLTAKTQQLTDSGP